MLRHGRQSNNVDMSTLKDEVIARACPWQGSDLPADLPLEDYPGVLLTRLAQAIHQEISAAYARPHGLSATEWRLLARLSVEPPMLLRDLCVALAIDKAYASRMLRTLQAQGYLEVASDPSHGRRLIVTITRAGRALAKRLLPQARRNQSQLLEVLDETERVVLYGALKKLQAAVDARGAVSRAAEGSAALHRAAGAHPRSRT